jgi:hypothetical protein
VLLKNSESDYFFLLPPKSEYFISRDGSSSATVIPIARVMSGLVEVSWHPWWFWSFYIPGNRLQIVLLLKTWTWAGQQYRDSRTVPCGTPLLIIVEMLHQRLLHKLNHYGPRGKTFQWIQSFSNNLTQSVVLKGYQSQRVILTKVILYAKPKIFWSTCTFRYSNKNSYEFKKKNCYSCSPYWRTTGTSKN